MTMRVAIVLTAFGAALWTGAAMAVDSVKPIEGPAVSGQIEISRYEIVVRQGAITKKIPVNTVDYITFESEPLSLKTARVECLKEEFDEALKKLEKIDLDDLRRPEVKADYQFYKAIATVRLAIGGEGAKPAAGKLLLEFEKNYPQSYHYLQACEGLGELLVSMGKYEMASNYYEKLAESPWPEYKLHAAVLLANSLQAQKKYKEAIAKYDEVAAMEASGKNAEREKATARLGRATALAGAGRSEEAIKLLNGLIDKADDEDAEFYAKAYNALGTCYRSAGKIKEAQRAYLHTDLLYSRASAEHAEALANLAVLWTQTNQGNRGKQALKTLKERYPSSPWAASASTK